MARKEPSQEGFEGVLSMSPRGFGFVMSQGKDDVYVPTDGVRGAMHGDRVFVRIHGRSSRGSEGHIERVVARRNPRIAGVLRRRGKSSWLEPDDSRIRGPIVLASAKSAMDGAAAVARITRFPEASNENPEGELVEVLGVPGDPNVEVKKILVREQVEEEHPDAAVREAEAMAARLGRARLDGRRDLRDVPLPTIDPEDARDHDDAIWVDKLGDGYRAYVAIADVSEYVQPGSALDAEAKTRGCTIYLPDRAIPMLPAALAADLCSLLPEQERLAVCVIADLDSDGVVEKFELVEAVIRSQAMLTYGGVAKTLGFTEAGPVSPQAESFKKGLRVLDELARKLRRRRMNRGALDLDLPEARVVLDPETGVPVDVARRAQDSGVKRAYSMVEELMLLANEVVARYLQQKKSPAIYRVHGKPDEKKLERLGLVARKLGVDVDLAALGEARGVSRWLAKIQRHPRKTVLEMLLLRSLKQATYEVTNIGHFGLASEAYVHFTSPIRRYPDVEIHRAVKRLIRGGKPETSASALETLQASATRSSTRERAVMDIEREVVDLCRALLMRDRIGEVLEGTVSALTGTGAYVSLDAPYVDVLVRFEAMGPDRYEVGDDEISVVGSRSGDVIALGDRMVVSIDDVAVLRRTVYARRVVPEAILRKFEANVPPSERGRGSGARRRGPPGKGGGAERGRSDHPRGRNDHARGRGDHARGRGDRHERRGPRGRRR